MERTWKPTTAGILAIIAGVLGIVGGAMTLTFSAIGGLFGMPFGLPGFWVGAAVGWGVAQIILGIIAIIGGNHARNRRKWNWALTGCILAIPAFVPLGILALIFVIMGKNEFDS
jgi:hypothetical protein